MASDMRKAVLSKMETTTTEAGDLISRSALLAACRGREVKVRIGDDPFETVRRQGAIFKSVVTEAPAVDAIPIDDVAEMLADLFGEECCCNYNGIDEWLPMLCENSDTCPDTIGKNGCWKQFIKHWKERKHDAST